MQSTPHIGHDLASSRRAPLSGTSPRHEGRPQNRKSPRTCPRQWAAEGALREHREGDINHARTVADDLTVSTWLAGRQSRSIQCLVASSH